MSTLAVTIDRVSRSDQVHTCRSKVWT